MRRILLQLQDYFKSKSELTEQEQFLLKEISGELEFYIISRLHRDDLKGKGFDISSISDETMSEIASRLESDYTEQLFWQSLEIIASIGLNVPKSKLFCPICECYDINYQIETNEHVCQGCGTEWSDQFVLVEYPDDSTYFEEEEIGYPSFIREDNGARYVPEHEYILLFQKKPDPNLYYRVCQWPDSQELLDEVKSDDSMEEITDEKALKDFICPAYWVHVPPRKMEIQHEYNYDFEQLVLCRFKDLDELKVRVEEIGLKVLSITYEDMEHRDDPESGFKQADLSLLIDLDAGKEGKYAHVTIFYYVDRTENIVIVETAFRWE